MAPKNILIVDDSLFFQTIIQTILHKQSFQIRSAEDGLVATALLELEPTPDLIILDIDMPKMNGIELLKWLQEREKFKEIPIVIATSGAIRESLKINTQIIASLNKNIADIVTVVMNHFNEGYQQSPAI